MNDINYDDNTKDADGDEKESDEKATKFNQTGIPTWNPNPCCHPEVWKRYPSRGKLQKCSCKSCARMQIQIKQNKNRNKLKYFNQQKNKRGVLQFIQKQNLNRQKKMKEKGKAIKKNTTETLKSKNNITK